VKNYAKIWRLENSHLKCTHTFSSFHISKYWKELNEIQRMNEWMNEWTIEVLREHRPPPSANIHIIELLNEFCNANYLYSLDLSPLGTFSMIQWIRISDFGLLDPDGVPDSLQNERIGPWAMPYPSKKFRQNPFTTFSVIRRTDKQTNRPKWKHHLLLRQK